MLDPQGREDWYRLFLESALKFPAARGSPRQARKWAKSMSLIAEQFVDNRDPEPAEPVS